MGHMSNGPTEPQGELGGHRVYVGDPANAVGSEERASSWRRRGQGRGIDHGITGPHGVRLSLGGKYHVLLEPEQRGAYRADEEY